MNAYLVALGVGLLVGVIYGALDVRSPAPPVVALVGLLGILVGEQIPPLIKRAVAGEISVSAVREQCGGHLFGHLPKGPAASPTVADAARPGADAGAPGGDPRG